MTKLIRQIVSLVVCFCFFQLPNVLGIWPSVELCRQLCDIGNCSAFSRKGGILQIQEGCLWVKVTKMRKMPTSLAFTCLWHIHIDRCPHGTNFDHNCRQSWHCLFLQADDVCCSGDECDTQDETSVKHDALLMVPLKSSSTHGFKMNLSDRRTSPHSYAFLGSRLTAIGLLYLKSKSMFLVSNRTGLISIHRSGKRKVISTRARSILSSIRADEEENLIFLVYFSIVHMKYELCRVTMNGTHWTSLATSECFHDCHVELDKTQKRVYFNQWLKIFLLDYEGKQIKLILETQKSISQFTYVSYLKTVFYRMERSLMRLTTGETSFKLLTLPRRDIRAILFSSNTLYMNPLQSLPYIYKVNLSKNATVTKMTVSKRNEYLLTLM